MNTFLPLSQTITTIDQVFITQEPNVSSLTTLHTIHTAGNLSYLSLTLKLLKNKATTKLQLNRENTENHLTLLLSNFSQEAQELITFLEDERLAPNSRKSQNERIHTISRNCYPEYCEFEK